MQCFDVPLYHIKLYVGIDTKPSCIAKCLDADAVDDWDSSVDARTDFYAADLAKIAVSFRCIDASVVAHEAVHIKNLIYRRIGNEVDRHCDEPEAYLVEWIVETCMSYIDKHKSDYEAYLKRRNEQDS